MALIIDFLRGVAIGLANIIPGVSGGTMALVLGIYERLIRAVKNIGVQTFTAPLRGWTALVEEFKRVDGLFLGALGVGAVAAVVGTAKLMVYLLNQQHDPTYGFFFGLVLLSVWVPWRMINKKTVATLLSGLVAVALVVGVTLGLSGEQQVESARRKAKIALEKKKNREAVKLAAGGSATVTEKKKSSLPTDGATMLLFFVAGMVAVSAMILPGISGSFVLLLMGAYFDVLTAVNERNFLLLGVLALGCAVGLLAFTRLINFMLERYHDLSMAFLTGLVVGSLYAIWPFKTFAIVGDKRVDMANTLPGGFGANEVMTLLAVVAGCAVVGVFLWVEKKREPAEGRAA